MRHTFEQVAHRACAFFTMPQPHVYRANRAAEDRPKDCFRLGMLFKTLEGKLRFMIHHAEANGPRKPQT